MLDRLQQDHRNFARLLDVLERQLAVFERGDRPDYDVLTAIASYFTGFPDRCHHPMEDLILRRMRERYPAAAEFVGDLGAEHHSIDTLASDFRDAVQNVLNEVEISRTEFSRILRHFIDQQRRHMKMEQDRFFPVAREVLTADDWLELEAMATDERDTLFGGEDVGEFEALRTRILRWQAEDEAGSS